MQFQNRSSSAGAGASDQQLEIRRMRQRKIRYVMRGRAGALLAEAGDDAAPTSNEVEILELTLCLPPGTPLGARLSSAAKVEAIFPPSPAATAGLQRDDVLLEVNGKEVSNECFSAVAAVNAGLNASTDENHTLKVRRRAVWAEAPPMGPSPGRPPPGPPGPRGLRLLDAPASITPPGDRHKSLHRVSRGGRRGRHVDQRVAAAAPLDADPNVEPLNLEEQWYAFVEAKAEELAAAAGARAMLAAFRAWSLLWRHGRAARRLLLLRREAAEAKARARLDAVLGWPAAATRTRAAGVSVAPTPAPASPPVSPPVSPPAPAPPLPPDLAAPTPAVAPTPTRAAPPPIPAATLRRVSVSAKRLVSVADHLYSLGRAADQARRRFGRGGGAGSWHAGVVAAATFAVTRGLASPAARDVWEAAAAAASSVATDDDARRRAALVASASLLVGVLGGCRRAAGGGGEDDGEDDAKRRFEADAALDSVALAKLIVKRLDDAPVVGLEDAKPTLASLVAHQVEGSGAMQHLLLSGPGSSGKAFLLRKLGEVFALPVVIEAASADFNCANILLELSKKAGGDEARAKRGIVVLEGVEKLFAEGGDAAPQWDRLTTVVAGMTARGAALEGNLFVLILSGVDPRVRSLVERMPAELRLRLESVQCEALTEAELKRVLENEILPRHPCAGQSLDIDTLVADARASEAPALHLEHSVRGRALRATMQCDLR